MDKNNELTEFEFMLMMYGYSVQGTPDFSVRISEPGYTMSHTCWDENAKYLSGIKLNGETPPEKYALWWLLEHVRREETK